MRLFFRRSAIIVGGWALSFVILILFGLYLARINTVRNGDVLATLSTDLRLMVWVMYPTVFAVLGVFTSFFERSRPLLLVNFVILPVLAFVSVSFAFHKSVLVIAPTYLLLAIAASFLTYSWRKRRNIPAS
jgi:hypothetical protein